MGRGAPATATVSRVMRHHAFVVGTVQEWYGEEGWGVLRTPDGLSVFCHFSAIEMPGYRALRPGQQVRFDYYTPGQDGCDACVMTRAVPIEG